MAVKHIAFTMSVGRRAIKRVALGGGPALTLTDSLVDLGGVSWASDGYIYYDGHLEGDGVARVRETGGKPEVATKPDPAAGETYHFNPSALPDGRGVLFVITRNQNPAAADIAVLDLRTGKHKVLTHGLRAAYVAPGYLLYVADGGALMAAPFDLGALELRGEGVALTGGVSVRGNSRSDVSVSTAGTLLYASGNTMGLKRELVWVTREGNATPVDPSWNADIGGRPALSPDGRTVAVAIGTPGTRQVWVKQLDRGPASRVSDLGIVPAWSPDGRSLTYLTADGAWHVPADGSALPSRLWTTNGPASSMSITRDGKWIVYALHGDLYARRTDGDTTTRLLVSDPGTQYVPNVSPDGRWLAYTSDETGMLQVYVRPFPDAKVAKRQVSVASGTAPIWSSDGKELFFVNPSTLDLVSNPVVSGGGFATGNPRRLFSVAQLVTAAGQYFDVEPDGKRFLFTRPVGASVAQPDELVLVQNFVEELKARVKRK